MNEKIDRVLNTIWRALAHFYLDDDESLELLPREYNSKEIKICINNEWFIVEVRKL